MPRLPGEPGSVEADPRMLPTNTGEREKKEQRVEERKKLEGRKGGEQSRESLGERLFPLHARQLARFHMNGHEINTRRSLFTSVRGSCCRWPRPSPASSPSQPWAWHHQPPAGPEPPRRSPDGQRWRCRTHHPRRQCPHHLKRTKDKGWDTEHLTGWSTGVRVKERRCMYLCHASADAAWWGSPRTWRVCWAWAAWRGHHHAGRYPGWRGRWGCSRDARSTWSRGCASWRSPQSGKREQGEELLVYVVNPFGPEADSKKLLLKPNLRLLKTLKFLFDCLYIYARF